MAKEKDPTLTKEERKALRKAEKDKKRSDSDGVHKSKDSKREKKKERAVLSEQVANAVENGAIAVEEVEEEEKEGVKNEGEDGNADSKLKMTMRPVGALVPFANPLADEKVAKKVFRGVKKGMSILVRGGLNSYLGLTTSSHSSTSSKYAFSPPHEFPC